MVLTTFGSTLGLVEQVALALGEFKLGQSIQSMGDGPAREPRVNEIVWLLA